MKIHLNRLKELVKKKRSIVGWVLWLLAVIWKRLGDWQNVEWLGNHLLPKAWPKPMLHPNYITVTLIIGGIFWFSILLLPEKQNIEEKSPPRKKSMSQAVFGFIGGTIAVILVLALISRLYIPIYKPFRPAYDKSLGEPKSEAESAGVVSFHVHEHAVVIWIQSQQLHFIIHDRKGDWVLQKDFAPASSVSESLLFNDELLAKKYPNEFGHIPHDKGLHGPKGSIARWWQQDPRTWEQDIGWRRWSCNYPGKERRDLEHPTRESVYFQQFQKGWMIGFLPRVDASPENSSLQAGVVYILIDNDSRKIARSKELFNSKPPECEPNDWANPMLPHEF